MKNNLEEWVKIDAILHEKLKQLDLLDIKRNEILEKAEKSEALSPNLKAEMERNLSMYEKLAKEVEELKYKAQSIKNQINKFIIIL